MRNRYKVLLAIIAALLLVMVGLTFAYYVAKITTEGEGSSVDVQTANVGDATIHVEGNLSLGTNETETDILPGHKSVAKIKVSADRGEATQDINVNYNLVWKGKNEFTTDLKYSVYKTYNKDAEINISCEEIKEVVDTEIRVSENCKLTGVNIDLETTKISGDNNIIPPTEGEEEKVILMPNQSILAKEESKLSETEVYYFVVVEYQNIDEDQSEDMSTETTTKKLNGIVTVEPVGEYTTFKDYILAKTQLQTDEPDFSKTSCTKGTNNGDDCEEETVGLYKCIIKDDGQCVKQDELNNLDTTNLKTTYYYRGNVEDNYVEFASFYWRIIRINENGSLRLIYQGRTKDDNGNKLEIQKTGDETQIGKSAFNTKYSQAEYVGFKYTLGEIHGNGTKSTILEESLEPWYQENIVEKGLESHIDKETGFCGDRSAFIDTSGTTEGGGTGTTQTYYGAYIRLVTNKQPTFECPNSGDLYKTGIGLITADEVAYAGGKYGINNYSYYLHTVRNYWTISPHDFYRGSDAFVFVVNNVSVLDYYFLLSNSNIGVRPVINVSTANLSISGNGTIDSPYVLQ